MPWTYILRCADGSYYVGSTYHLESRVAQHNSAEGGAAYTRRRQPVVLVWCEWSERMQDAYAFEKRVQGWSRAKREALIRGDFDAVSAAGKRRTRRRGSQTG
jgi:putative endonuclease